MAIIKRFGDTKIKFTEFDDDVWVPIADVGRALEYSQPSKDANRLFRNHIDELNEFSTKSRSGTSEIRYLSEQGVYLFCMLSEAKKAKEFRKWVAKVLQELRKKVDLSPARYLLAQAQRFVDLEDQGQLFALQIRQHTEEIAQLKDVLLPETKITEEQAENIREAISTIAFRYDQDKPPFGMVWGRAKNELGFASYREIPREKYSYIMQVLDAWLRSFKKKNRSIDSFFD